MDGGTRVHRMRTGGNGAFDVMYSCALSGLRGRPGAGLNKIDPPRLFTCHPTTAYLHNSQQQRAVPMPDEVMPDMVIAMASYTSAEM